MKHTLFILDYFHPFIGGIETLFDDVTQFCSKKNMKITILTSRHRPDLKKVEKRWHVTIYRVGHNRFTIILAAVWFIVKHKELITSVDHIHTSTFTSSISAWIIAKIWHKPITITIHEIYNTLRYHLKWWKGRFYIRFEWFVCYLPWENIITVSQSSKITLQKIYPKLTNDKISVFLNQIDTTVWNRESVSEDEQNTLRQSHHISESDKLLVFVGRLWYEKWLPYLIEAFSDIKDKYPDTKLVIIAPHTKANYNKWIQQHIDNTLKQIKDNYLTNHIIRIDPVKSDEELKTWMSICHIGIVPSMSEGFCYTAVQMQAMWLQLIASQVGALPEVLDHNNTIFVPYGKVQSLCEALEKSLHNQANLRTKNQELGTIDYSDYYNLFTQ